MDIPTQKRLIKFMFIVMVIFGCVGKSSAQTATKWYFGIDMGLDFTTAPPSVINTGTPVVYNNTGLDGYNVESSSVVYDNTGNLVFLALPSALGEYSIYDKNFNKVYTALKTTSDAAQGSLAFPVPGSTTTWYVSTVDAMTSTCGGGDNGTNRGANYHLVTNTGTTVTVSAPDTLVSSGVAECQVGVANATGTGYWLIIHKLGVGAGTSNQFNVYSVTTTGISLSGTYSVGFAFGACDYVSQLAVNDCNNQLALAVSSENIVSLFNFNDTTGVISNPQQWTMPTGECPYGLEYSTNSTYLYVSTGSGGCTATPSVYQYNVSSDVAATVSATQVLLGTTNGGEGKSGHLQLGPDGNIYVAQLSSYGGYGYPQYIGQISNINLATAAFNKTYIAVNDVNSKMAVTMGLPTILKASITGTAKLQLPSANTICANASSTFSYTFTGDAVSQTWTLTPATGFSYVSPSTSASASPTINFTTAGVYHLKVQVKDNCGYTYQDTTSIKVNPQVYSAGTTSCAPNDGNVTAPGAYTYVWYADATGTDPIASGTTNVPLPIGGAGSVYVEATSGATSTPNGLTNGPAGYPAGGSVAVTTNNFTVNKAPLTFTSFNWSAPYNGYAASNVYTTYTIKLVDITTGVTMYTTTQSVALTGPTWVAGYNYTVNVNTSLPIGNYQIQITGGNVLKGTCTSSEADGSGALTFYTAGGSCIATDFVYTYTSYNVTALACSNMSAAIPYNCPMPVTWVSFNANRTGEGMAVSLAWVTGIEENSKVFYVQRSLDGVNFQTIGEVDAAGNSGVATSYQYLDASAPAGTVYYRLSEVDIDGSSMYSTIVYVNGANVLNLSLVPNPGSGSFRIIGLPSDTKLDVSVYSVTGQPVYSATTYPGDLIDLAGVAKGFYLVNILAGESEQTLRFINQ